MNGRRGCTLKSHRRRKKQQAPPQRPADVPIEQPTGIRGHHQFEDSEGTRHHYPQSVVIARADGMIF
jgi:hypothetical protein